MDFCSSPFFHHLICAGFSDLLDKVMLQQPNFFSYFFSFSQDILVGLLRLRKCGRNTTCPELLGKCSVVRELHVYGTAVPVHGRESDKLQHQVPGPDIHTMVFL